MRGSIKIINSQQDKQAAGLSRESIIQQATIQVRYDDAIYPQDYDHINTREGDTGYVTPMYRFETEVDQGVLERFGIVL